MHGDGGADLRTLLVLLQAGGFESGFTQRKSAMWMAGSRTVGVMPCPCTQRSLGMALKA